MRSASTWRAVLPAMCLILSLGAPGASAAPAAGPMPGVPAGEGRVPYYLPHMTWEEVEEYLRTSDMVIVPLGSIEQHGKHLPLGSDSIEATEVSLRIGQKTGVLVAPAVLAGVSEHHMGFPGTISLSPATFEAVLDDAARSLMAHGFRRIMIYNGHGGNTPSVSAVVSRLNRETSATVVDLSRIEQPPPDPNLAAIKFDYHAGVEETSWMLHLAGGLVQMAKAENPRLTFPPEVQAILDRTTGPNQGALLDVMLFEPARSGKRTSTREVSNIGAVTTGDIKSASAEIGKAGVEATVAAAVRFIETWRQARR